MTQSGSHAAEDGPQPEARHALAGDTARYLPSVVASAAAGLLVLPVVTRLLPQESFGNYSLMMAAASLLQVMTTMWLGSTIVRFHPVAAAEGTERELISTGLLATAAFSTAVSALAVAVAVGGRAFFSRELWQLLLLLPLLIIPFNVVSVPLQTLRVERRIGAYTVLNVARLFAPPLAGAAAVFLFGATATAWVAGWVTALILIVPPSFAVAFGRAQQPALGHFSRRWLDRVVSYGVPLIPAFILVKVLEISDRFIIGAFRPESDVALYSAAYTIAATPIDLILLLFSSAAAPILTITWERVGREASESLLRAITEGFVLVAVPSVFGLAAVAVPALHVLASRPYGVAAPVMPVVAAGSLALGLQWIAQRGMMLGGDTLRIMWCYAGAGAVNIIANLLLVPRFGYIAAAWTTLLANVVLLVLVMAGSARYMTWRFPFATALRAVIAAGVMAAVLLAIPPLVDADLLELAWRCTAGSAIYVAMLFATGERPSRFLNIRRVLAGQAGAR